MGILDNLKNVLGGKKDNSISSTTKAPSQVLKENGVDPSQLKFSFGSDGTVTVTGLVARNTDKERIKELLLNIAGIKKVVLDVSEVAATASIPSAANEESAESSSGAGPEAGNADAAASEESADKSPAGPKTYTVQPGDTLWKIAKQFHGDGKEYMKIFEANKDLLKDPDHIYPGQELVIPDQTT